MSSYKNAINFLYSLTNFEASRTLFLKEKPSTKNIKKILQNLGIDFELEKVINITGTKGKGSTAIFLSRLLSFYNKHNGLFVSPHIFSPLERISVNNKYIPEKQFTTLTERVKEVMKAYDIKLTTFEAFTLIALLYFKQSKVDYIILEAGIEGFFDSTNIGKSDYFIVTFIDNDHTFTFKSKKQYIKEELAPLLNSHNAKIYLQKQLSYTLKNFKMYVKKDFIYLPYFYTIYPGYVKLFGKVFPFSSYTEKISNVHSFLTSLVFAVNEGIISSDELLEMDIEEKYWEWKPLARFELHKFGKNYIAVDIAHTPITIENSIKKFKEIVGKDRFQIVLLLFKDKYFLGISKILKAFPNTSKYYLHVKDFSYDVKDGAIFDKIYYLEDWESIKDILLELIQKDHTLLLGSTRLAEQFYKYFHKDIEWFRSSKEKELFLDTST